MAAPSQTGPIFLRPKLDERLWGGSRLGPLLGLADPPARLAEVWQVHEDNRIDGGELEGRTLREACQLAGPALLGTEVERRHGRRFPLLTKLIDAAADLSLQVHPDDAYARRAGGEGELGKSEAWYFLDCVPGGNVIHGFSREVDRESFRHRLGDGTVLEVVRRVPVRAGQALFVPAGALHAITGGILLFEVQQRSDATYRVWDYDRAEAGGRKRPLHVDRALDVLRFAPGGPSAVDAPPGGGTLVKCEYFEMEKLCLDRRLERRTDPRSFEILVALDPLELRWGERSARLPRGHSVLLPADLGEYQLEAGGPAAALRCTVPASQERRG